MNASIHNVKQVTINKGEDLGAGTFSTHVKVYSTSFIEGRERPVVFDLTLFAESSIIVEDAES
jgi:hypothetical protein